MSFNMPAGNNRQSSANNKRPVNRIKGMVSNKANGTEKSGTTATKAGQQQVASYLGSNPDFLENYVINNVDLETVERWVIRKARSTQNGGKNLVVFRF